MTRNRYLATITIIFMLNTLFASNSLALAVELDDLTPQQILERSNQEVEEIYGKKDYFPTRTSMGKYREDLILNRLNAYKSKSDDEYRYRGFEIVYGGDHGARLKDGLMEFSGYTRHGESISSEGVGWTAGWSGKQIHDFNIIKFPWQDKRLSIWKNDFDLYKNPDNKYLTNGTLEEAIQSALNTNYAGHKYSEFIYDNQNSNLVNQIVYTLNMKPQNGGQWIDYVHILQPPTYFSEGYGIIYIENRAGRITYLDIPISALSAIDHQEDISAQFETLPSMSKAGEQVRVGVRVTSTFTSSEPASYSWTLTKKINGKQLTQTQDQLTFSGNSTTSSGKLSLVKGKEYILYATFNMPESDVAIDFKINEKGTSPKEKYLGNNVIHSDPYAVRLVEPQPLAYNVLTKKVKLPIMGGAPMKAQLTLPRGSWSGNATGALNVVNQSLNLLRNFVVTNNPAVNEASTTITRSPIAQFLIDRKDFGDDPANGKWLNIPNPSQPLTKDGEISYSGSVSRNYEYHYQVCEKDDDDKEVCTSHTDRGTASADFPSGTDNQTYEMYVYNGRKTIPAQSFSNEIQNNQVSSRSKKLMWESEPDLYNVIRWMYHLDENNQPYDYTAVGGQYEREFTQQASGSLKWSAESTLQEQYAQARKSAANKTSVKSMYDKAVFATDKDLQKYNYPIKSGYYFNPAGSYTFTIETVSYKPTSGDTQDHKDLVSAIVDSFRYESDLIYINAKQEAVNIRNERLNKRGAGFDRSMGVLTAQNKQGVDGQVLLQVLDRSADASRFTKKVEEIEYSQASTGYTHEYWKKVLEGYSESKTNDSYNNYRYREYVKDGQKMYKITEKTVVTIVINPANVPVYTHANMANGDYHIRVWIDDVSLSKGNHEYKKLGSIKGIDNLDSMQITVKGSMYDDLNN